MPQTFDDLNDLCTKAHDLEMHLSKRRSTQSPRQLPAVETAGVEAKKKKNAVTTANRFIVLDAPNENSNEDQLVQSAASLEAEPLAMNDDSSIDLSGRRSG